MAAAGSASWRADLDMAEAERLAAEADSQLRVPEPIERGTGGELVPQGQASIDKPGIAMLVKSPQWTALHASEQRLDLAANAECFDLAADTAEDINARDNTERMLAHQMAAAHTLAMKMIGRATQQLDRADSHSSLDAHVRLADSGAKLAVVGARLMDAYQRGMKTLYRVRTGNQQTMTVVHQHVNVGAGGQAAVAGAVQTGEPGGRVVGGDAE